MMGVWDSVSRWRWVSGCLDLVVVWWVLSEEWM